MSNLDVSMDTLDNLINLTKSKLQDLAKKKKLKTTGTKEALINRIKEAITKDQTEVEITNLSVESDINTTTTSYNDSNIIHNLTDDTLYPELVSPLGGDDIEVMEEDISPTDSIHMEFAQDRFSETAGSNQEEITPIPTTTTPIPTTPENMENLLETRDFTENLNIEVDDTINSKEQALDDYQLYDDVDDNEFDDLNEDYDDDDDDDGNFDINSKELLYYENELLNEDNIDEVNITDRDNIDYQDNDDNNDNNDNEDGNENNQPMEATSSMENNSNNNNNNDNNNNNNNDNNKDENAIVSPLFVIQADTDIKDTTIIIDDNNNNNNNEDEVVVDVGAENLEVECSKSKKNENEKVKRPDSSIRCNLWISNLHTTSATALKNVFSSYGTVMSAKIVAKAAQSGEKSKYFGYVTMGTPEEAEMSLNKLNNSMFEGKIITVEIAKSALPNVITNKSMSSVRSSEDKTVTKSEKTAERDKTTHEHRRIVLVKGRDGSKLIRVKEDRSSDKPHPRHKSLSLTRNTANTTATTTTTTTAATTTTTTATNNNNSNTRQVREIRDTRPHRVSSTHDRRVVLDRRMSRHSPPPPPHGRPVMQPPNRRVISRSDQELPIRSDRRPDNIRFRPDMRMRNPIPMQNRPMMPQHDRRDIEARFEEKRVEESRKMAEKRRLEDEIRKREQFEKDIREREYRDKQRLMKEMRERELAKEREFREREKELRDRERLEREKRLTLENQLREKEQRERELLKEKDKHLKVLRDLRLAKHDKEVESMSKLKDEMMILSQKQKQERHKLELRLKEYQTREKERARDEQIKDKQIEERMMEKEKLEHERRLRESRDKKPDTYSIPMGARQLKRPYDEPRRDQTRHSPEKRMREQPHNIVPYQNNNYNIGARWPGEPAEKIQKHNATSHEYSGNRSESYHNTGRREAPYSQHMQPSHSSTTQQAPTSSSNTNSSSSSRYNKQEEYFDRVDSSNNPNYSRYSGNSNTQRKSRPQDQSSHMHKYQSSGSYDRSDRHINEGHRKSHTEVRTSSNRPLISDTHHSRDASDTRNSSSYRAVGEHGQSGASSSSTRHRMVPSNPSNVTAHPTTNDRNIMAPSHWNAGAANSFVAAAAAATATNPMNFAQRALSFDKLRPQMPPFLPPGPVLPNTSGFMQSSLAQTAASLLGNFPMPAPRAATNPYQFRPNTYQ